MDARVKRTIQVIRYDTEKGRIRSNCNETHPLSWANPARGTGKTGGYPPLKPAQTRS